MSANVVSDRALAAMTNNEAAAYWFVRRDSETMTAEDEACFQQWLETSTANRLAYEQTDAMWSGFAEAADEGELRALRVAALAAAPAPRVWTSRGGSRSFDPCNHQLRRLHRLPRDPIRFLRAECIHCYPIRDRPQSAFDHHLV